MAAQAAARDASLETLLGAAQFDVPAWQGFADAIGADHATRPAGDPAAFHQRIAGESMLDAQRVELRTHAKPLARRERTGRIRLIDGHPVDTLFDLSKPLARLVALGRGNEANLLANRYVDVVPQGATGWALLPLYLSLSAENPLLAEAVLAPAPPRLVAIGGLSGVGKSSLARLVGARIGRVPGARVLRSDVFRKRLAGLHPETRLAPAHYTRRSDQRTYEALFESADDHLACGNCVILDAVFMSRSERDVAEAIAHRARVPFTGIWLEAPERD
ncbi:MAG: aminoglycoside phosphotransferase, partial [Sphingomonadales bacterium]